MSSYRGQASPGMLPYGTLSKRPMSVSGHISYSSQPGRPQHATKTATQQPFRLMDITVSVVALNGILMASKKKKDKRINDPGLRYSCSNESEGGIPVTGVVSFSKNVTSSQTSIASHFPSLPLQPSGQQSNANRHRFLASWPKDYDQMGNKIATFKISRMMRKPISHNGYTLSSKSSIPVPERIRLSIGLSRGSEILNLGSSTLILMGDELRNAQMNLPVSIEKNSSSDDEGLRINSTSSHSSLFGKQPRKKALKNLRPVHFAKDPQRKYTLDQNALLKIVVNVVPSQNYTNENNMNAMNTSGLLSEHHFTNSVHSSRIGRASRSRSGSRSASGSAIETRNEVQASRSRSSSSGSRISKAGSRNFYAKPQVQQYQVERDNETRWRTSNSFDHSSYSFTSEVESRQEQKFTKPSIFCGGLCNFMQMNGNSGNCTSSDRFLKLQEQTMKSTNFDAASVMPTYRYMNDNDSHFIPPSKVYAKSYSAEEGSDEEENTYSLADSIYSDDDETYQGRNDVHSVVTEKFNNTTSELREMEETRVNYANRMGVNPDTLI